MDTNHLYNILAGKGHFEKSDGSMLNVIQMIAEGFNESKALRTLVHDRFTKTESALESLADIMNGRFQNVESQLDEQIKKGGAGNPT